MIVTIQCYSNLLPMLRLKRQPSDNEDRNVDQVDVRDVPRNLRIGTLMWAQLWE